LRRRFWQKFGAEGSFLGEGELPNEASGSDGEFVLGIWARGVPAITPLELDEHQSKMLKAIAEESGVCESDVVRQLIVTAFDLLIGRADLRLAELRLKLDANHTLRGGISNEAREYARDCEQLQRQEATLAQYRVLLGGRECISNVLGNVADRDCTKNHE
jgi:hypothetical protein